MTLSRKVALGVATALAVAACAFLFAVLAGRGLQQAATWAGFVAALAAVVAAVAALWPLAARAPVARRVSPPELPDWVVDRPGEVSQVVKALLAAGRGTTAGTTTGLHGARGFGKTTLARMACADRRVQRRFGGHVYWVTVGRGVQAEALAAKINDVIRLVGGEEATYTDSEAAGQALGALLDAGPLRLLVVDDVWEPECRLRLHAADLGSCRRAPASSHAR